MLIGGDELLVSSQKRAPSKAALLKASSDSRGDREKCTGRFDVLLSRSQKEMASQENASQQAEVPHEDIEEYAELLGIVKVAEDGISNNSRLTIPGFIRDHGDGAPQLLADVPVQTPSGASETDVSSAGTDVLSGFEQTKAETTVEHRVGRMGKAVQKIQIISDTAVSQESFLKKSVQETSHDVPSILDQVDGFRDVVAQLRLQALGLGNLTDASLATEQMETEMEPITQRQASSHMAFSLVAENGKKDSKFSCLEPVQVSDLPRVGDVSRPPSGGVEPPRLNDTIPVRSYRTEADLKALLSDLDRRLAESVPETVRREDIKTFSALQDELAFLAGPDPFRGGPRKDVSFSSVDILPQKGLPGMAHSVVNVVRFLQANGEVKAQIVVEPPALGRVEIQIHATPGGMEASLRVDSLAVRDMIRPQVPLLQDLLAEQGITLSGMNIDVRSGDDQRQQWNGGGKRRRGDNSVAETPVEETESPIARIDLERGLLVWMA
ncbi:MAG: hypothetical protein CSA35_06930 [Dethiosulfovibrio peptidovorans]|nr:MAG: hypothetical protein CSA35_06930 [Dethiosulfovibrio peptidovorans]